MPLGSSSAAPVVRPGPSAPQARRAIVLMDAISTSPYGSSARDEGKRAQKLLRTKSAAPYVNPEDYFPAIAQGRADETTRKAYPVTINGKPGMLTRKVFDSSRYQYGGVLKGLWVDISAEENFAMVADDPLSLAGFTKSTMTLERSDLGWRTRSETTTNVWSETDGKGGYLFRYLAMIKTFTGPEGADQPFAEKTVHGDIARSWI
jgi:hypothetical protein